MSLTQGARVGPYEIVAPLGAGGMGEVYRARDSRLGRDVAIKVLPAAVSGNPERRARFAREAQVLASLNHPHIAQVYGVEETAGSLALVMELVEGDTLDALIAGRGLPVAEALPIAREIAEALEAAHERGVIHRDLKPANVKVTPAGRVKVLDFGLAKAMDSSGAMSDLANSPTFVSAATQFGTIVGTAAYMAPEQARGKPVDKRADIWAFGCVLYEMLTGRRAFDGETITDILTAIVHKQPDMSVLPGDTPPAVRLLLERCLEKDASRRLRDIGEARLALESTAAVAARPGDAAPTPVPPPVRRRAASLGVSLLIAGLSAGALIAWLVLRGAAPASPPLRLSITLPPNYVIARPPAISPDGKTIAYVAGPADGQREIYLRNLDSFDARRVDSSVGAGEPFFSPDGRSIGFFAVGSLWRASVAGGPAAPIAPIEDLVGAVWLADNTIVFSKGVGSVLWRVAADGGAPEALTAFDTARKDYAHVHPEALPDGRVLYTVWTGNNDGSAECALTLGDRRSECRFGLSGFRYIASGHYIAEGTPGLAVAAVGASLASQSSDFQPLLPNVYWTPNGERSFFAVSNTGTLVYVPGSPAHQRVVWLAPDGTSTPVLKEDAIYGALSLSPDGTRLAYGGEGDIWMLDLARGTKTRITAHQGNNLHPQWAPDGRRLFFSSNRDERWAIYAAQEDDQWAATQIVKRDQAASTPSLARDGTMIFLQSQPGAGRMLMARAPDGTIAPVLSNRTAVNAATISPDARFVAYSTDASAGGRLEVFVKPLHGGAPLQVSTQGGDQPTWSRSGDWIYYLQGPTVMGAPIDANGHPELPRTAVNTILPVRYGVTPSPDGKRFLAVVLEPDAIARDLRIVTNFFDDVRRAAAGTR